MAEKYADEYLVPFEVGLQASETILMWGLGGFFWLASLVLMGLLIGWEFTLFGIVTFVLGLVMVLVSQIISSYDPMKTMRFPVTGLLMWLWIVFLSFWVLLKGYTVYIGSGTSTVVFTIVFFALAILATGGLLVANFMTDVKIVNWLNVPLNTYLMVAGIVGAIAGVVHTGFSLKGLMFIDTLSIFDWILLAAFGISFMLFIELNHAAHRFNDIIHYAKRKAVGEFSLTPVINNYYIMGFILTVVILSAVLVLLLVNGFVREISTFVNEQFANSVMLNSVYSLFLTTMVLLIPLFIAMVLFFSYRARKEKEEEDELRRSSEKTQRAVY